jgi:hypothetical protein
MTCRSVLSLGVVVLGLSAIGCAGGAAERLAPTAPSLDQNAGSSAGDTRPPQPPGPNPPPATGTCVAEQAQWTVGKPASATLLERARVDATASIARFIRPNEAITLEYSGARLNLYLNEREVVHGVVCG